MDRFYRDRDRARDEQDAVGFGHEHFGAAEAERVTRCRRSYRDPHRGVRHGERDNVGDHMDAVGEERERTKDEPPNEFDAEKCRVGTQRDQQGTLAGVGSDR